MSGGPPPGGCARDPAYYINLSTSTSIPETVAVRAGAYPVGPELPPSPRRGLERLALPGPRALLSGILVVRLVLIAMALGRALGPPEGPSENALAASITALAAAALAATVWLFWSLRRSSDAPGPNSVLIQAAVDVMVVTTLVTFQTTSTATVVAALYIVLVTVYALLLPVGRGLLVVALASASYIAVTVHASSTCPDARFWSQVVVIAFVGALIAVLGNRLIEASREQRALAAALVQARLEADEILGSIQSGVLRVDGDGRLGYLNPPGRLILTADSASFIPGQPVLEILRARSRDLYDAITRGIADGGAGGARRSGRCGAPTGRSFRSASAPPPSSRPAPPGGGDGDLHRHLRPEAAAGAAPARRAAGGGGGAERVAGARDPESAGVDPQRGRAARPPRRRRRGRADSSPA